MPVRRRLRRRTGQVTPTNRNTWSKGAGIGAGLRAGANHLYQNSDKYVKTIKSIQNLKGKIRAKNKMPQRTKRSQLNYQVDGTISTYKNITYKTTRLDKTASFIGSEFIHETQNFGTIAHIAGDEVNSQKVALITSMYEQADTLNIFNFAYQNGPPLGPLNQGPLLQPLNNNISGSYKFYLNSCVTTWEGTNMSAGASELTLYTLMCKNTTGLFNDPISDWNEGLDDASGAAGQTLVNAARIGTKPTSSKLFNMKWKIVDRKKYNVGPGGKVTHTFKFAPRNLIDTEYWGRHYHVKGMTYYIMAVCHGQMGKVDNSNVTYPSAPMPKTVDWVYNITKKYSSKMVNSFPRQIYQFYQLPNITVGVTQPINIREDDGELES